MSWEMAVDWELVATQEVNNGIYGDPFFLFSQVDDAIDLIMQEGRGTRSLLSDPCTPPWPDRSWENQPYIDLALQWV